MPLRPAVAPAFAACAAGFLVTFAVQVKAAEPCGPNAICGLKDAEDLVRVGASQWALASSLTPNPSAPGGVYLVDLKARTFAALAPDTSRPAAPAYAGCPGAPDTARMVTHGLDLRLGKGGRGELYVINHGDRQSVEVFDFAMDGSAARLTWKGCVIVPAEMSANAVAALPDGFAVTSFGVRGDKAAADDLVAGRPSGFVSTWSPAAGWKRVADSELPGDNGIAASADGRTLYVNAWGDGTLRVLDLGGARPPRTVPLGDFHPDNVHWTPEGQLLVAGQVGERSQALDCGTAPVCPMGSMVVTVDPRTLAVRARMRSRPAPEFGAASVAVAYGGGYWLSSYLGDRVVRHPEGEGIGRP